MKWVTRARPVIDRIACPWLIARFIDKEPEFLFVPPERVRAVAEETGAIPYDVPGVELTHVGEGCSFDTFLAKYGLDDPALGELARIGFPVHVRALEGGRLGSPGEFWQALGGKPRPFFNYSLIFALPVSDPEVSTAAVTATRVEIGRKTP